MSLPAVPKPMMSDCRWTRPGYRVADIEEHLQPERETICVRGPHRRGVSDEECGDCLHWEARQAEPRR